MSVIECSADGLAGLAPDVIKWANIEGLTAHARSVELRLREKTPGTES
jgi:histidinol dehydrogenase